MKLTEKLKSHKVKQGAPKKRRMVVVHKRQITAVCLLILVGVAGYLNWSFGRDAIDPEVAQVYNQVTKKMGEAQMVSTTPTEEASKETNDYFSRAKLERDVNRSESIDTLTKLIDSGSSDKATRSRAEDEIHLLTDFSEKEVMIENLIRAKGYEDVVVFMGENLISLAVKSEGLNEIDVAILQDIAISTAGYPADKIKIVEIH